MLEVWSKSMKRAQRLIHFSTHSPKFGARVRRPEKFCLREKYWKIAGKIKSKYTVSDEKKIVIAVKHVRRP